MAPEPRPVAEPWPHGPVLVTGGTGFIGRHVLAAGVGRGAEVHDASRRGPAPEGVTHHGVDVRDPEAVREVVEKVRPAAILHLAAAGVGRGDDHPAALLAANAGGLACVLEAALATGDTPVVVAAGTGAEYAPQDRPVAEDDPVGPVTAYGASKAAAAVVAGWYGARLPVTLLRLFNVYGEGEPLPRLGPAIVDGARRGRPVPLTGCRQVRDMTYAGDVAEAFWRAAAGPPETDRLRVLNVGTGTPVVLERYVAALAAELEGRGLPPVLRIGALPYRPDEAMTYLPAVGRLRDTLGWLPPTTLAQGLARMVDGW